MKTTTQVITYLSTHPWLKKGFQKLNNKEVEILASFFDNSPADASQAHEAVNKMFMDYKGALPKNWTTISELASSGTTFRFQ